MNKPHIPWHPRYTLTPAIARALMDIEAARTVVEHTPLPPATEAELRRRARIRSTHYNYYEGRAEADLTQWLEYFAKTLALVFTAAKDEAQRYAARGVPAEPEELRRLDHRARTALSLFAKTQEVTTSQVAATLGLSERMARLLLNTWVKDGWLVITNPSNRKRAYGLSAVYRQYIYSLSAMHGVEK